MACLCRLIPAGAFLMVLSLVATRPVSAETASRSLELRVSGGATGLEVVELIDGHEVGSNTALGIEPGLAIALRFGSTLVAGLGYERIVGSVETPELPGEWGLGANQFSMFAEIHRRLGQDRPVAPSLGLGASLGRISLGDELDLGPGVTELSLAGTCMTARVYGIAAIQLNDRLGFRLVAGYRFGSIPHDERSYSATFTDLEGRTRDFDADLETGYASLALSMVVWGTR